MRAMKYWILAALSVSLVGVTIAEEKADKKPATIKEVMKKAHSAPKGEEKMCQKFAAGKLSEAEVKDLVALYADLGKNKPPKGDEDSWKAKTSALAAAAKDLAANPKKEDSVAAYKKALDCMSCHSVHRPPPPPKDK